MLFRSVLTGAMTAAFAFQLHAADYGAYGDPFSFRPAIHDWSGGYAGVHGGWNWSEYSANGLLFDDPFSASVKTDGAAVGVHSGYGLQMDSLYVGLEADLSYLDRKIGPDWASLANRWQGSLRGRLGWALDDLLLYATGGVAGTQTRLSVLDHSESDFHLGWVVGAGAEAIVNDRWLVRGEYLYSEFRDSYAFPAIDSDISLSLDSHVARAGVSYRFGE